MNAQVPIIGYNADKAAASFARYRALRLAERDDPTLSEDLAFKEMLSEAYLAFSSAFLVKQ